MITDDERRARLGVRHALATPARSVEDAVDAVVCLHATEPASVHLSAFARSGATRDDVDRALYEDRTVVRQLAMRRTVFAFPRDLLPAARGSAAARVAAQLAARLAKEVEAGGLAEDGGAWVRDASDAVVARLREKPATTPQLRAALPALDLRLVMAPGKPWGGEFPIAPRVLSTLAAGGAVVRGRNDAGWKVSRPFWTAAEDWLGAPPDALDERAGYAELVARWLARFGPGAEADLVWWLGATKGSVRRALGDVGAVAVALADGRPAWLHPDDTEEVAPPAPWAALLPALDPTTMGWKERGFYLGDHAERIFDRNGNAGPTAWWAGRVVGGWTQRDDGTVVVVPAGALPTAAREPLARSAARRWSRNSGLSTGAPDSFPLVAAVEFTSVVDDVSRIIDGVGVAVVVVGLLFATVAFLRAQGRPPATPPAYRLFRQQVGKAILLGLEFLVAADIIRTVAVAPSFKGVGVLAVVVAVRTFLSFTLDVELEGRWPWQQRTEGHAS